MPCVDLFPILVLGFCLWLAPDEYVYVARRSSILVVDDDRDFLDALVASLEDEYQVTTACCGAEALSAVRASAPSLVILDIRLPDTSGIELLDKLKLHDPSLPVAMLTGYGADDLAALCVRHHADDYVKKDAGLEGITRAIERLLEVWPSAVESRLAERLLRKARNPQVHRAVRYMCDHCCGRTELADIAQEAGLSPKYFSTLFVKETGTSPTGFLVELRMERARELLRTTGMMVNNIAGQVGYGCPSHFRRVFRRTQGCTPTEWRVRTRKRRSRRRIRA